MNPDSMIFRRRIITLRWLLPISFALLAVLYEFSVARWIHDRYGDTSHFIVEALFFSTSGPILTFLAINQIRVWLGEKERAEVKARDSNRRLASITHASADAILSLDQKSQIESWNRGAELLFGYTTEEVMGQPFSFLFPGDHAAEVETKWLESVVHKEGFVQNHETDCRNATGQAIDVELTATNLNDDQGHSIGMSVILRDITNRKRREEEIRRLNSSLNQQVAERTRELAEKVKELGQANTALQKVDQMRSELVSLVSHQLRAPLTNMSGAVQRIKSDCPVLNPTCTRMLQILSQQTLRLDHLVKDVLNAARLEAGEMFLQPEPVSVLPVLQQSVEQMQARTDNRRIHLRETPGLPMIYADRDRVVEILVNLLDNAVKYSPPEAEVNLEVRADQTHVTVSVLDNGPGLPPSDLERIFDKYYRLDGSDSQVAYGYGLGLYVCRLLTEALGGRIWAENRPSAGAAISFTLPVWQGERG